MASTFTYAIRIRRLRALFDSKRPTAFGIGSGILRLQAGMQADAVLVRSPPMAEQAAIVRFLDHADRRIRRYIRAKQKLIKLLEEQKQAIIHRAVTRGLDPTSASSRPAWSGWGMCRSIGR